jgi:hypothetical protein
VVESGPALGNWQQSEIRTQVMGCESLKPPDELQRFWDEKLKESGLKDAEKTVRGKRVLKDTASSINKKSKQTVWVEKSNYFELVTENIVKTNFETLTEELVMRKHAEGKGISEIVQDLQNLKIKIYRGTIRFIIRRFEHLWGIREWTSKDRRLKRG